MLFVIYGPYGWTDEAAVRKSIHDYVVASNTGNIETLIAAWNENAIWIDSDGQRLDGITEIAEELRSGLAGKAQLEISEFRIRLVSPQAAIEEGTASLSLDGVNLGKAAYEAVQVIGWDAAKGQIRSWI